MILHRNIDTHRLTFQNFIQSPIISINSWSFHVNLRTQHPIRNEYLLRRTFQSIRHGTHITGTVHEPGRLHSRPDRSERLMRIGHSEVPRRIVRHLLHVRHPLLGRPSRRVLHNQIPRIRHNLQSISHTRTVHPGGNVEPLVEQHHAP